jgi:hypothetical protein
VLVDLDILEVRLFGFQRVGLQVGFEGGILEIAGVDLVGASGGNPVPGLDGVTEVAFELDGDGCALPADGTLGWPLEFDGLVIRHLRLVCVQAERALAVTALALVGFLHVLPRLGDPGEGPAALALEGRRLDAGFLL